MAARGAVIVMTAARSSAPISGPAFTTTAPSFCTARKQAIISGQLGSVNSTRSPRRMPRLDSPPAVRFTWASNCLYVQRVAP